MTLSPPIKVGVLTVSDRCSRGEAADTSGPGLAEIARERLGAVIAVTGTVPDEVDRLSAVFLEWAAPSLGLDLILSTGGTGLAPRDVTPEAAMRVIQRPHPGLMELARHRCLAKTPRAFLSRGVAGVINRTLLLTLPGSPRGSRENLEALLDILPHAIETLRGDVQDDGRPDASPVTGRVIAHED
ncbi:MAG: MogA/MoaB family molybdenum cofactor biosynthesis protein [Phycisphaeraceae bacterium]|nr:MogA/MoaB family molybdenum cofactor biosynthesis protein [Phycisphaeraceae bacterium]